MVKLTVSDIERKCSETSIKKNNIRNGNDRLKKMTHLIMNDKNIDSIGDLSVCRNLKVIYFQNNNLIRIENLQFATNLTHLYLQHNKLTKIENLENLKNLEKLYLGYNKITIVEGMENLVKLTELHIENQKMTTEESLYFEPRTISTLSKCLQFLNISGNRITTLDQIREFSKLKILKAENNLIKDIEDTTDVVSSLSHLQELFLRDNPINQCYRYRENLIANSRQLMILDGKLINDTCRDFMKKFRDVKQLKINKKQSKTTLSDDITSSLNLPFAFKMSVSRAISQQFDFKSSNLSGSINGELQPYMFPPWKSVPSIRGLKDHHHLPRPFWKSAINIKEKVQK